jgi:hypothetical protein
MKRIAVLSLTTLTAIAVLVYAFDYSVWQYKLATGHASYGTLTVRFY